MDELARNPGPRAGERAAQRLVEVGLAQTRLAREARSRELAGQLALEGEGAERRYRGIEQGAEDGQILGRQLDVEHRRLAARRAVEAAGDLGREHIGIAGRGVEPLDPEAAAGLGQPGRGSERAERGQPPLQRQAEECAEIALERHPGRGVAEEEHVVDPARDPDRPVRRPGAQIEAFEIEALEPAGETAARLESAEVGQGTIQNPPQRCARGCTGRETNIDTLDGGLGLEPDVAHSARGGDAQLICAADPQVEVGELERLRSAGQREACVERTELGQRTIQKLCQRRCGRRLGLEVKVDALDRELGREPDVADRAGGGDGELVRAADPQVEIGELERLRSAGQGEACVDRTEVGQGSVQKLCQRRCGRRLGLEVKVDALDRELGREPDVADSARGGDGELVRAADLQVEVGELQRLRSAGQGEASVERTELGERTVQKLCQWRGRGRLGLEVKVDALDREVGREDGCRRPRRWRRW